MQRAMRTVLEWPQSHATSKNYKYEPQQKHRLGTQQKLLGGLNRFYGIPTSPSASIMAQNIQLFGPRDISGYSRCKTVTNTDCTSKNTLNIVWNKGFLFIRVLKYFSLLKRLYGAKERHETNVLSNVAGFHDVISVINVQNIYQPVQ